MGHYGTSNYACVIDNQNKCISIQSAGHLNYNELRGAWHGLCEPTPHDMWFLHNSLEDYKFESPRALESSGVIKVSSGALPMGIYQWEHRNVGNLGDVDLIELTLKPVSRR